MKKQANAVFDISLFVDVVVGEHVEFCRSFVEEKGLHSYSDKIAALSQGCLFIHWLGDYN